MRLKSINIEQVAKTIEADADMPLNGLRESLAQAKAGISARIHTPEQILVRQAKLRLNLALPLLAKQKRKKHSFSEKSG